LPELLAAGSELWLDGGHNPAAGEVLAQSLADLEDRSPRPLHLIVGMMGLKDAEGFLRPFRGLARGVIAVPIPGAHEATHAPVALAEAARVVGLSARVAGDVPDALRMLDAAHPGPKRILICGSLYLAGQVLGLQEGVAVQGN
jgi:dihydrofolate synthase / folylpolyglutamate synthase